MIDPPKTLAEAQAHRYHKWAGNPRGYPYVPSRCAYEVFRHHLPSQCGRNKGYGPDGLYCRQHALKVGSTADTNEVGPK